MSDLVDKIKSLRSNGLFIAFVIGMLIRLLFIPFSLEYDTNFWGIVVRNIETGNGLYLMEGYYYTPVWGYILGLVAGIQNAILSIGDPSRICYELISYNCGTGYAYTDMATSFTFMLVLKLILWICDLVLSMTVYQLVEERNGDKRKAIIAFVLVFICPHVIGSSSMIVMPDTISAMFTMLTILLLKHDRYLLAGVCYSFAVWVKFFPIAIILVLLCYIYVEAKGDKKDAAKRIALSIIGFMGTTIIIFLPQAMEGTLSRSLAFLTDRVNEIIYYGILSILAAVFMAILATAVVIFVARHMLKYRENIEDRMMEYGMVILCICMLLYTNVQYIVTLIPFLVYCIMVVDHHYKYIWAVLAVAGVILTFSLNTNVVMLNSIIEYTGLISADSVLPIFDALNTVVVFGFSIIDMFCSFANNVQKIILVCILPAFILRRMIANNKIPRWHHER